MNVVKATIMDMDICTKAGPVTSDRRKDRWRFHWCKYC